MQTRKQQNKKRIQKLIAIQKLNVNELFQIKGGESDPIDKDFD